MKLNFPRFAVLLAALVLSVAAFAQTDPDAERVSKKIRQLFVLNQILPVLMTPEQIRQILPAIEHARSTERHMIEDEVDKMRGGEGEIDRAIKAAMVGQKITTGQAKATISGLLDTLASRRSKVFKDEAEKVRVAMVKVLNRGQIRAAQESLDARWIDDRLDVDKLTPEQKLRTWIRLILLDPEAYPYLLQKSRE